MERDLMTTKQAAEFVQLNPEVLRRLAFDGKIPAGRIGGQWRFSRRQLIEWVESGGHFRTEAQRKLAIDTK